MAAFKGDSIFWIETSKIVPNPYQPRREFDEEKLKELSESIRMYGVLQPLTVSRKEVTSEDGAFRTEYELIAGERRLRASKLANVEQVPVIIREGDDSEQEKLELAIIENLQREDLNAVDRALAFKQLAETFDLSHSQVAKKVGRSREYVSNSIRLLNLPEYMLDSIKTGDISEGHARTLLMLNDRPEEQDTLYRETLMKKLTVREVERIARKIATDKVRKQQWKGSDPELIEKEKQFTETLGTRVQLTKTDYGGKITIDYFSDEDLDLLLNTLAHKEAEAQLGESVSPVTSAANAVGAQTQVDDLAASTPLEPVMSPEPVEPPSAPVVEEPTTSDAEAVPESSPEPAPAVAPEVPPTPEPAPVEHSPVASPPETEAATEPAQPADTNSLRSKLADMFGATVASNTPESTPVTPQTDTAVVAEEAVTPAQQETEAPTVDEAEAKEATDAKKDDTDSDDLYGVKNFSI